MLGRAAIHGLGRSQKEMVGGHRDRIDLSTPGHLHEVSGGDRANHGAQGRFAPGARLGHQDGTTVHKSGRPQAEFRAQARTRKGKENPSEEKSREASALSEHRSRRIELRADSHSGLKYASSAGLYPAPRSSICRLRSPSRHAALIARFRKAQAIGDSNDAIAPIRCDVD